MIFLERNAIVAIIDWHNPFMIIKCLMPLTSMAEVLSYSKTKG